MGLLLIPAVMWALGFALIGTGVDQLWGNGWASLAVGVYSGLSAFVFFFRIKYTYQRQVRHWIAFRLPRSLAYWCAIRVGAHATQGKWGNQIVPELLFVDALKRWDDRA